MDAHCSTMPGLTALRERSRSARLAASLLRQRYGSGQTQKNAAICLGRLAKNPHCLQAIRDNNGIEILARSMSKMGMAPGR